MAKKYSSKPAEVPAQFAVSQAASTGKSKGSFGAALRKGAAVVATFFILAAATLGLGGCFGKDPSTAHIGATATGSEIVYQAGKDAKYVDVSVKKVGDAKNIEYGKKQAVTKGQKVTVDLNQAEMYDGTYTIKIYEGASADELSTKAFFEKTFERTGNPEIVVSEDLSVAKLIGSNIEYKAGKDIGYVFVSIKDKDGKEYGSGMTVTPGQEVSYSLNQSHIYNGEYGVGVKDGAASGSLVNTVLIDGQPLADWTRVGNPAPVLQDFCISGVSVTDGYTNTGIVGTAPTRDTKIYFNSNEKPDSVAVSLTGAFTTQNKTFPGSQIVSSDGNYYVDASSMLSGINSVTVNVKLDAKLNENSNTVQAGNSIVDDYSFTATDLKVAPVAMPAFTGYDIVTISGQKYLNLNLTALPSALAGNAELSIAYNKSGESLRFNETKTVAQYKQLGYTIEDSNGIVTIKIPIDSDHNYTNIEANLTPKAEQELLIGQSSKMVIPDIVQVNYQGLISALNLKIGKALSKTDQRINLNPTTNEYDMELLVGTDGKVRAKWESDVFGKSIYAEYTIPGVTETSTPAQWIAAVANMTVPTNPSTANFTETGMLTLNDAQILFDFALNSTRADTTDKTLLAGAEVLMVKSAKKTANGYGISTFVLANGTVYEYIFDINATANLNNLAQSGDKTISGFPSKGASFTPANDLFSAQGLQPPVITTFGAPVASQSSAVTASLRTASQQASVTSGAGVQNKTATSNAARSSFLNKKHGTPYGQTRNQLRNQYKQGPNQYGQGR